MRLLIRSRLRKTGFGISLSRNGKRSTVVGVPGTCPPRPLNGLLITDFLTPDTNCEYTYPGELKAEIERLVGEYIVDVRDFRSGEQIRASHPRFTTAK